MMRKYNIKISCNCDSQHYYQHDYNSQYLQHFYQSYYQQCMGGKVQGMNEVQWDQSSPDISASHYSDQSIIKLDFLAA